MERTVKPRHPAFVFGLAALAAASMLSACQQQAEEPTATAAAATAAPATAVVGQAPTTTSTTPAPETPATPATEPTTPVTTQTPAAPVTPPALPKAPPAKAVVQPAGLPAGAGRDVVIRVCTGCHAADAITVQGRTAAGWDEVLGQMQNMGMSASDEDLATVRAYLVRELPPR